MRAKFANERGEVSAKTDRRVVHDERDEFQEYGASGREEIAERVASFSNAARGEPDEYRKDDEREHVGGGEELAELVHGEGLHDLITNRFGLFDGPWIGECDVHGGDRGRD